MKYQYTKINSNAWEKKSENDTNKTIPFDLSMRGQRCISVVEPYMCEVLDSCPSTENKQISQQKLSSNVKWWEINFTKKGIDLHTESFKAFEKN